MDNKGNRHRDNGVGKLCEGLKLGINWFENPRLSEGI